MKQDRLEQLVEQFAGRRVVVIGDVMLDQFTWGLVERISPEAPVPIVKVTDETYGPGACGNVAANIQALGGIPITIALVGRDAEADRLASLFAGMGMSADGLVPTDRQTTLKTRIIAHNQQIVRTDREDRTPVPDSVNEELAGRFAEALGDASAVVVCDYNKGAANPGLLGRILPMAEGAGVPVFLDPKLDHADDYRPITLIKPNHHEAEALSGIRIHDRSSAEEAGRRLLGRFKCPYVLITRGKDGMSLFGDDGTHHIEAAGRRVFDVTGAGDTVIATLALARAAGGSFIEAARVANRAAGIVVGRVGTATVAPAELIESPLV